MINFSTLKGLTIPEGVVKQITDSAGRVLWKAAPTEASAPSTNSSGNDNR